jgi:hypothetical protein
MGCGHHSNPADAIRQQQMQQQAATDAAVQGINKAFQPFDKSYYDKISQSYLNYALPQLADQMRQSQQQLGYRFGRGGLLDSSVAQKGKAELGKEAAAGQSQIAGAAQQQANQFQQQIENQRANLIGQAQQASSPGTLSQQAQQIALGTQAPSTFAPLGNMFSQLGNMYLANQMNNQYNQYANQYLNALNNPALNTGGGYSPSFGAFQPANYR